MPDGLRGAGRIAASLLALAATAGIATPTAAADQPDVSSLALTATYTVAATFGWNDRNVHVDTTIDVTDSVPWTTSVLALNLATLRTGHANVNSVTVDGQAVTPDIQDQTILVTLPHPLATDDYATVAVSYDAHLNLSPSAAGDGPEFAQASDVMTAYRWIPWLSRTTQFNRPSTDGDPWVTNTSPQVDVTITSDIALKIASTGSQTSASGMTQAFEARNVRDFNFSASPDYQTATTNVGNTRITFYYLSLPPNQVLGTAAHALRAFGTHLGEYAGPELNIGEVGPWWPIESPGHFWLPSNAGSLLTWEVAHETAHQWFYSLVGNDQAREPFADEALTDFVARDLLNDFVPSQCPPGRLDHTIYDIADCYAWVVYVQGDAYLRSYRAQIGANAFWRGLADYVAEYRYGIGGTRAVLDALARASGKPPDLRLFPTLYPPFVRSVLPPRLPLL